MAPPPVVVGSQFCASRMLPLTLTSNLTVGSTITDSGGAVVLQVDVHLFSYPRRHVLLDAAGDPLLTVQRKVPSIHKTWQAFRGDSTSSRYLLFTAKKSPISVWTQVDIFLGSNSAHRACDFRMKGNYNDRWCDVYLGNSKTKIAQIHRRYTAAGALVGKDTFSVTVFPNVDHVFVTALVVILDEICRDRRLR
ncbi:hypothetical protein ACP70R_048225 [Stipagrostis hirtigluma subsp. patula]